MATLQFDKNYYLELCNIDCRSDNEALLIYYYNCYFLITTQKLYTTKLKLRHNSVLLSS